MSANSASFPFSPYSVASHLFSFARERIWGSSTSKEPLPTIEGLDLSAESVENLKTIQTAFSYLATSKNPSALEPLQRAFSELPLEKIVQVLGTSLTADSLSKMRTLILENRNKSFTKPSIKSMDGAHLSYKKRSQKR